MRNRMLPGFLAPARNAMAKAARVVWDLWTARGLPLLGARGWAVAGWLAIVAFLLFVHGTALLASLGHQTSPNWLNADARQQIFPFFRYLGPSAFDDDYIAGYYLDCYPLGYRGLYTLAAWVGIDPLDLSRYLPHLLWLLAVGLLGTAAHKLGGRLAALTTMALALGSNIYLWRIGGGLPRSFGYPILAGTLVSLAYGRAFWCAACVTAGALFYPVTAVISGFSLAGMVLAPERLGLEPPAWSFPRRLGFVVATAFVAVALLVPTALAAGQYGGAVRPNETTEFPETGSGGRYDANSRAPFKGFFAFAADNVDKTLLGAKPAWSPTARTWLMGGARSRQSSRFDALKLGLLVLSLAGTLGLAWRRPAARRVLLLVVAAYTGHALASVSAPYVYLPERYAAYTVPLLVTLGVGAAVAGFFPRSFDDGPRRVVRILLHGVYTAAILLLLGGHVSAKAGVNVNVEPRWPVLERIAQLPPNVLIAGWPTDVVEEVPLLSRRRVLLNQEVHQVFHKDYVREMRHRLRGLVDAYFATSLKPILRLRNEFSVTHLVIRRSDFGSKPPDYFIPFDRWIDRRFAEGRREGFEVLRQVENAEVFAWGDYVLLDLSRIERAPERRAADRDSAATGD